MRVWSSGRIKPWDTPMGGFIEGADVHGLELVPTVFATAYPSGPPPREVFDAILKEMLQRIAEAGSIDGVLFNLHGSMAAQSTWCPNRVCTAWTIFLSTGWDAKYTRSMTCSIKQQGWAS